MKDKLEIKSHCVMNRGRKFLGRDKKETWSITVYEAEYTFQHDNLQNCTLDKDNPFFFKKQELVGNATESIDHDCVWSTREECWIHATLNKYLGIGWDIPLELWKQVRTWIKRNYILMNQETE